LEKLFQAVAFVQKFANERKLLLLRWNPQQARWRFIVGRRLGPESFRETTMREVGWQLKLNRKTDFIVSSMAQLSIEYSGTLPSDYAAKHIAVSFYPVHIYRSSVLKKLSEDEDNRWVSATEICDGKTADGQTIDPDVVHWINHWQVLRPWE
jgi:hypothetical protein